MSFQLADRSVKYPVRIVEDILVRISQMYIPNFLVMDIIKNSHIMILLGRPFLATSGAIIDVKRAKLTFDDTCCFVDIIDKCLKELLLEALPTIELVVSPTPTTELKEDEVGIYLDEGLEE